MHPVRNVFSLHIFQILMQDIFYKIPKLFFIIVPKRSRILDSEVNVQVKCDYLVDYGCLVPCPCLCRNPGIIILLHID